LKTISPSKALGKLKNEHDNNKIQGWENARPRIMRGGLAR
jgi:hypothetical protein